MVGSDLVSRQAVDMGAQQSLSLEPGIHYLTITATGAGSESVNPSGITYHPPTVETAAPTQIPRDTPVPPRHR
ncbi:hypothetical protein [Methanogenium cariaci]|uniref:hypothetical protein n=1 Tax=Methanogenium cariaci TaxID=2197 RepID=UPI00078312FF|nr:hypothetical protein [Methanogenium cariaci]